MTDLKLQYVVKDLVVNEYLNQWGLNLIDDIGQAGRFGSTEEAEQAIKTYLGPKFPSNNQFFEIIKVYRH